LNPIAVSDDSSIEQMLILIALQLFDGGDGARQDRGGAAPRDRGSAVSPIGEFGDASDKCRS